MMRQRTQLFKRLEVAEAMQAFISHHPSGIEELRTKLERVEADLAVAQKVVANRVETLKLVEGEKGAIWAKADQLKEKMRGYGGQVQRDGVGELSIKERGG